MYFRLLELGGFLLQSVYVHVHVVQSLLDLRKQLDQVSPHGPHHRLDESSLTSEICLHAAVLHEVGGGSKAIALLQFPLIVELLHATGAPLVEDVKGHHSCADVAGVYQHCDHVSWCQ